MNDVISLSDIAYWVSKKFESVRTAPMLTIQVDSERRMMQISTATGKYVYVVVGRAPGTFNLEPFIDFIFLDDACPSLEKLLRLVEDSSAKRMTINRVNNLIQHDVIETRVVAALWEHLMVLSPQPA
ncbi:hypothetical protein [Burkholderia phage FLC9]|nr:hypothetical protein [Burkholderia phage FLC9]